MVYGIVFAVRLLFAVNDMSFRESVDYFVRDNKTYPQWEQSQHILRKVFHKYSPRKPFTELMENAIIRHGPHPVDVLFYLGCNFYIAILLFGVAPMTIVSIVPVIAVSLDKDGEPVTEELPLIEEHDIT